jgi:molybdopterin-guanine dinucleotide biosynthesis protein A
MGRDKALLPAAPFEFLWQRQWSILRELEPQRIFWSGWARPGLPAEMEIVGDKVEGAGPLAGISACLERAESDLLLVLAIDLPEMNAEFLQRMLARCGPGRGIVAYGQERFEPLAAVYPRQMGSLAQRHLAQKRHALQDFVREGEREGLVERLTLEASDAPLFRNVNSPADLAGD